MKKILLCSIIPFSILSNSNDFLVIVDKDHNEYKIAEGIEKIEYSEWVDEGVPYNCINQNPLSNSIYEGTSFEQTSDCEQDETRDQFTYLENSITGEKVLISTKEENNTYNIVKKENVVGTYEAISCDDVSQHQGNRGNGIYSIKPSTAKISAYCDMNNGGYSIYTMTSGTPKNTTEVETACDNIGMKLFVPRTESHLTDGVNYFGGNYFYLMGLYPDFKGASCSTVYFNSNTCSSWGARDGGKWFVYNWDMSYPHGEGGFGVYPEPNGDNETYLSMFYEFDSSTKKLLRLNDIAGNNPSYPNGYTTTKWACSAYDEESL